MTKQVHTVQPDASSANENAETPEQRRIRTGWLLSQVSRRRQRVNPPRPPSGHLHACSCGMSNWVDHYALDPIESCIACGATISQRKAAA